MKESEEVNHISLEMYFLVLYLLYEEEFILSHLSLCCDDKTYLLFSFVGGMTELFTYEELYIYKQNCTF